MYGIGLAVLGARDDGLGRGLAVWERGPLARWWFGVVFVSYWWFEGFCTRRWWFGVVFVSH